MKKTKEIIVMLLTLAMILALGNFSFAADKQTYTENGVTWEYYENDTNIYRLWCGNKTEVTGKVTVPSTINGKKVIEVSGEAFRGGKGITEVVIPEGVTTIGDNAFRECTGLSKVTLPQTLTSIGGSAFYGCKGISNITFPSKLTSIGSYAFYGCKGLQKITLPDSITTLGSDAFSDCEGLSSITLSNLLTSLEYETFRDCTALTTIVIPGSITSIEDYCFWDCNLLKSIKIPKNVVSINDYAFSSNLKKTITIYGEKGSVAETYANKNEITFDTIENYNPNGKQEAAGPKVKAINVVSPASGTYKAPQTVQIIAEFTEPIKGTAPSLRIKFGEGNIKTVSNGTVNNTSKYFGLTTGYVMPTNYVLWSYNIQNDDEGQLQIVSIDGGTLTGNSGVSAVITTPETKGNAIVANKTGTVTNNTENQDKVNDETKKDDGNTTPTTTTTTTEKTKNLDPDNLITWPLLITNGTGNLGVKSTETGYKLYYQCTELSDTNYDKIKKLSESGSNKYAESVVNLITKYDDSKWTQTTDKKMTITDLTKFSGSKKFVIWAKLVRSNGETVYDWEIYTVNGTKSTATTTNQNTTVTKTNTAKVDSTTANTILPKTGKDVIIYIAIGVAIVIGIVRYKKCKEYSDIK